jgi:predicted RNase H-like HicB family nuclease
MKTSYAAILAITLSTLATSYASAEAVYPDTPAATTAGKTRDQVRAELVEAQRTGNIQAFGNSGKNLNELYPNRYPAKAVAQGKTREQVLSELAQAQRSGEFTLQQNHG